MAIIKDMSKEIKNKAKSLPNPKDISNKIHKIDNKVLDKLNEDIIKEENLAKHKPHVCEEPAYERDYSYLCPEDWVKKSSDQCWGVNYDGHCESLKYFQDYSDEEKREFELNCCVLWPKLKNISKKTKKRDTLRGSINSKNGIIIKPRYM
ncbi:CPW-WPC family protein [Plasmodium brasilianum]|nr:CPW-WPC family protein [Plasmodium brasilianum]